MPIDELIAVFDKERDRYIEWHDGPRLDEVDAAMASLSPEERAAASRIVAERIGKGYDPYLGRAAELLGTGECRKALDDALGVTRDSHSAGNMARNILTLGKSDSAMEALMAIVGNRSLHWSARIDALVNLKIAMGAAADRPVTEFITPEFEAILFEAAADGEYLVRYHAAEALLRMAGGAGELSDDKELFGFVCGKHAVDGTPDVADREGFRRAVEILQERMGRARRDGG
ncbi:MAG: hypothetical protein KBA61_11160 [Spirochaetes bacterium]|nr:hypothetical protein [Spirochaetota bacterium]